MIRPGWARRAGRRSLLKIAFALTAVMATSGHAPYGQWNVYRKRNLLILTSRSDAPTYPLGERIARILADHLPSSRAQASRAPNLERVASLISTGQMDVAVLSRIDAANLSAGHAPFEAFGPVPLRSLVSLGNYLLVCRDDFPDRHAWLVAGALSDNRSELGMDGATLDARDAAGVVPAHPGAEAFFDGRPAPEGGE